MARTIIANTRNFTRRDAINSKNAEPLQDYVESFTEIKNVTKAAMLEVTDEETGEIKYVSVIITDDMVYTSISATIYDTIGDLIDIIDDEGHADIMVKRRKAKSGRDFLSMYVK